MTIELDTTSHSAAAGASLRGLLDGRVHLPGDEGYDAARIAWNLAVDQRPAAVAQPRTAAEVATVVRRAAEAGLRIAPQSTGHNAGPLAAQGLEDVVIVRTSEMSTAIADPARGIVRVEGGAVWEPAVQAAAAHGQAVLHGSSPDVGVAGYTLGGGIGWYARKHGLAANSLTAVELVVADGSLVRATADQHAELFWALRGGGGNFGVVTALEFSTYDIATAYAGMMLWPLSDVEPVLRTWAAWAPGAPDEITTAFRVMRLPDLPDLPDFLRGQELVIIDGAVLGSDERGEQLLADLRAHRPFLDTFARVPAPSLVRLHMDPEGGAPGVSGTAMLGALPDSAIDAFLGEVGPGADTSLLMAELRQLGGALGRPHPGGGVLDRLAGDFALFAGGLALCPEVGAQVHADAQRVVGALAPYATGATYLNFAEEVVDARAGYAADRWRQLAGIRSAVDPHDLFLANHRVPRLHEAGSPTT